MDFQNPRPWEIFRFTFLKHVWFRGWYRRYVRSLKFGGSDKVLDFGSGTGACALFIARKVRRAGELTCVDVSPFLMNILQRRLRRYENARFRLGDIRTLGLPDGYFDAVNIHFMLHDIPVGERESQVKELARVLRPSGRILIREPLREAHGMPSAEIRRLMTGAGLTEESGEERKEVYRGEFRK